MENLLLVTLDVLESVDVVVLPDNDSSSDTVSLSALVPTLKSPGSFLSASVK